MKRLILKRFSSSLDVTFGAVLDVNTGLPICLTLENPYKSNLTDISSIPTGLYKVSYRKGDKKFPFQVLDVFGRSGIMIHTGNLEKHTKGCILPGMSIGTLDGKPAVLSSGQAMDILIKYVEESDFELEVKSCWKVLLLFLG